MPHSSQTARFAVLFAALGLLVGLGVAAHVWAARRAMTQLEARVSGVAAQEVRLIDSELARYRMLLLALGEFRDLAPALNGDAAAAARLDGQLAHLAAQTKVPAIYAIAPDGRVVASSNAGTAESFVGRNFGYRPYFRQAMAEGAAEYHAVGELSGRPGLFLARRAGAEGVVVIKYEFQTLNRVWSEDPGESFILDPQGVILAATDAEEALRRLPAAPPESRAALAGSAQFPHATLEPSRYAPEAPGRWRGPEGEALLAEEREVAGTALRLLHVQPVAPALRGARELAWALTAAGGLLLAAGAGAAYWRLTRAARAAAERRDLERAVRARTAALSAEMAERARSDRRYREAREELEQANRLASLGLITAGLVHEINQPVATIRTLSENARAHLAAGRVDRAEANLDTAIALTARIGAITQAMRGFAGRRQTVPAPVPLREVVEGVLLLIGDRFRQAGVPLTLPPADPAWPEVLADRVRLEQVLVNLLQNALDAVRGQAAPQVALLLGAEPGLVTLTVADNGPGLDPALGIEVFHPFVTGKPGGLGLGLGIARDIMADLGGALRIVESPLGGAAFLAAVPRAEAGGPNA